MSRYVEVEDCLVVALTDDAALLDIEGEERWIPLSQIEEPHLLVKDETATVAIARWLAEKEGIS